MRGLYPIVDVDRLQALGGAPQSIVEFAERVLSAGPSLLQLRAKHSGTRDTLQLLRALRPVCARRGARLIANDRVDLALLAECDGVHVGQEDLPLPVVRALGPSLMIGVSTHDLEQLSAALAGRPGYVAFGPIYGTASKERPDETVGVASLRSAYTLARAAGIPLVAIGGIDLARAAEVAPHCDFGAVIAALQPTRDSLDGVAEAAGDLHAALGGSPRGTA